MKVSVYEAKSKLSQMINRALEGEEVIITRNGKEVATIQPIHQPRQSWIGMWKGQIKMHDSFNDPLEEEAYFTGEKETFLDKVLGEEKEDTGREGSE